MKETKTELKQDEPMRKQAKILSILEQHLILKLGNNS
jgi:hypothetical protein